GSRYATFQVRVEDGSLFSTSDTAMTVDVTPVEDAPMSGPSTVTTAEDLDYVFTSADFPFSDVDAGDTLQSVKITSLATAGTISYSGTAVTLNQVVTKADIDAGLLTFTPVANENGSPYATFQFKVADRTLFSACSGPERLALRDVQVPSVRRHSLQHERHDDDCERHGRRGRADGKSEHRDDSGGHGLHVQYGAVQLRGRGCGRHAAGGEDYRS